MTTRAARPERLEALVSAARSGDADAFGELVSSTSAEVFALALRLVGNEHDARDVVQETYLRAFRSIGRFRSEAAVSTWLYRIAANCSATLLRRRAGRCHDDLERALEVVETGRHGDPESALERVDDRARLLDALDALPDALRTVVVLRDAYDLPHAAIAAELGISRAAAKVRLHRARRRLRDALFEPPVATADTLAEPAPLVAIGDRRRVVARPERPRRAGASG